MDTIYLDTDHTLSVTLTDQDGAAVTVATVTATLYELDRVTEVAGQSWPTTLAHTSGGIYTGALSDALAVKANRRYLLKVVSVIGTTTTTDWQRVYAAYRDQ